MLHKGGEAVIGVIPRNFGIVEKYVGRQRGDRGPIQLSSGIRCQGRTLDVDGQPVPGLAVNIESVAHRDSERLRMASFVRRGTVSDAQGRFVFEPLPAGEYRVGVDDHVNDLLAKDRKTYAVPAVFRAERVTLNDAGDTSEVEVRAVPHVVIRAQYFDSAGNTTKGHAFFVSGKLDDKRWFATSHDKGWFGAGHPDENGAARLMVPRGLSDARLQLMTNEHGVLRFRMRPEVPLQNAFESVHLGTLNQDVNDFEIIRYKAPILLVSATDPSRRPIADVRVSARYGRPGVEPVVYGNSSNVNFERQDDGKYRSMQLRPDEDMTLTVSDDGYESSSQQLNLKEGVVKELSVILRKAEAQDAQ
jgi:hypothetical protein